MRAVLGIDAAWTENNPSGVALVAETGAGWELVAVESSYDRFVARSQGLQESNPRYTGSLPNVDELLDAARSLCADRPELVAIDMPMSQVEITGRRVSDNAISREYGKRKCSTHSPSRLRPGHISEVLRLGFERNGYKLLTTEVMTPGLIEVYPHPALVELVSAGKRLPYKVAKARKYWPSLNSSQRKSKIIEQWRCIVTTLSHYIDGLDCLKSCFDGELRGSQLKAAEDSIDAVVCAWIAICALEGKIKPYGDANSAIWIPSGSFRS